MRRRSLAVVFVGLVVAGLPFSGRAVAQEASPPPDDPARRLIQAEIQELSGGGN